MHEVVDASMIRTAKKNNVVLEMKEFKIEVQRASQRFAMRESLCSITHTQVVSNDFLNAPLVVGSPQKEMVTGTTDVIDPFSATGTLPQRPNRQALPQTSSLTGSLDNYTWTVTNSSIGRKQHQKTYQIASKRPGVLSVAGVYNFTTGNL
ncbi:uncharacterized protein CLUP02_00922 [Colletotrichum lupini]|uniref:Uncharacterized protein n=1 Tax=Colletotrichum lupini TaxID=145971 RepID=A0A9Q8W8P2_9PEZI|nr:uncharacterized protein CLUP02_00922 [Colletotrichum lupini]UQC74274.1 hypothetical protein CLUP02_00922 [Colletotrichum lupini]